MHISCRRTQKGGLLDMHSERVSWLLIVIVIWIRFCAIVYGGFSVCFCIIGEFSGLLRDWMDSGTCCESFMAYEDVCVHLHCAGYCI